MNEDELLELSERTALISEVHATIRRAERAEKQLQVIRAVYERHKEFFDIAADPKLGGEWVRKDIVLDLWQVIKTIAEST